MSYEKSEAWEKFNVLNSAVMDGSPSEAADVAGELRDLRFTAQALGLACRYRGLDMVRALVESDARFNDDGKSGQSDKSGNFAASLLSQIYLSEMSVVCNIGKVFNRPMLPIGDRLVILDYLRENADKTGFDEGELLFYSYFSGDKEITEHLKKNGAVISEEWVRIVTEGGGKDEKTKEKWFDYCSLMERLSDEDYLPCMTAVVSEVGGRKLYITDWMWHISTNRLGLPGFMKFLLLNFELSKMNKGMLMKEIILRDDVEALELAADNGWLKMAKKRDEMIAFAAENGKTECAAWLLDFKNRTADLVKEREKAEKRQQRELNAAPDSVTVMKQFWNFKKLGNGSLIITGYKGGKTEVIVPARIGKSEVKAIGEMAFSPLAPRLSGEVKVLRKTITKITLPETVERIGEQAFTLCKSLETVIISEGVTEIGFHAFSRCPKLECAQLPRSLANVDDVTEDSGLTMFDKSPNVTAVVFPKSYAEEYCILNKIPFKHKG